VHHAAASKVDGARAEHRIGAAGEGATGSDSGDRRQATAPGNGCGLRALAAGAWQVRSAATSRHQ
jgi:hypothetical protein